MNVISTHAVFNKSTGAHVHNCPANLAPAANDPTLAAVALPSGYADDTWTWDKAKKAFVEDIEKLRATTIARVKAEAEERKMGLLSPGGAKKTEYAEQAAEVRMFWSLGGTVSAVLLVLNAWPQSRRVAVFPCATANAAEFQDTIDKAIERFASGMTKSSSKQKFAALEAKACDAVAKATTAAAIRAAGTVNWPS